MKAPKVTKLISLLIAGTAAASVPAAGCYGTSSGYVVATYEEPPPPIRQEYVVYRPGFVWIHGNWRRDYGDRWRWQSGYYVRERPGYVYAPGRWERRGRSYYWVDGGWRSQTARAQGGVIVREHRTW